MPLTDTAIKNAKPADKPYTPAALSQLATDAAMWKRSGSPTNQMQNYKTMPCRRGLAFW